MERRFVTIHDVAADAHVSTATVSRALNEPWRVSAATRERVMASVDKLGYKPNLRARLLARGGSGTICFLLSNRPFIHSVHAQILQGAAKQSDEMGVQIVYATCHYEPDTPPSEIEMPRILAARGLIDGVIVAGTNYPNMLQALDELGLAHVVFGTNLVTPEDARVSNAVYVDDEDGGYQATEHLLALGHRQIAFIGDDQFPWYRRRYAGYRKAMTEAGLAPSLAVGSAAESELAMGYNAINDLYDRNQQFTAVVVGGDMGALGALRALRNRGVNVPNEVSVVGFNDEELVQIAEPPLTTVRVPKEDIGARCVVMLDAIIEGAGEVVEPEIVGVQLVLRQSAAALQKTAATSGSRAPVKNNRNK